MSTHASESPPKRRVPMWLDRLLSPADAIGPVFVKEIRSSSRKYSPFGVRMTYVLFLMIAFWVACEAVLANASRFGVGRVELVQRLQAIAPAIAVAVMWIQLVMLLLTAPATTASAFCDERRKRTLDVLLLTPVKPWRIVLGKLFAGVTQLFVLSLCSLPVLLAASVYGGLEWRWVLMGAGLTLSVSTLCAMLSLLCSMWVKKASTASFLSFIGVAVIQGLPLLVCTTIILATSIKTRAGPPAWIMDMFSLSSVIGYLSLTYSLVGESRFPISPVGACLTGIVYSAAWTGLLFLFATSTLRKVMLASFTGEGGKRVVVAVRAVGENADKAEPADERAGSRRAARRLALSGSREVSDEPVLWRELTQPLVKKPVAATLGGLALAGITIWAYVLGSYGSPESATISTTMIFTVIMLVQAAFSSTSGITVEREARTWDMLLSTPLSARRIVLGKFAGALKSCWPMAAVVLANIVLVNVIPGRISPRAALHAIMIVPGPIMLLSASGTYMSLKSKSTAKASTQNLLFAILVWGGVPFGAAVTLALAEWLGWSSISARNSTGEHLIDVALFYNPVMQMFSAIFNSFERSGLSRSYALGPGIEHLSLGQFTALVGLSLIGYATLTAAFLALTARALRKQRQTMG